LLRWKAPAVTICSPGWRPSSSIFADDGGDGDDGAFFGVFLEEHGGEHGGFVTGPGVGQFHADADGAGFGIDGVADEGEFAAEGEIGEGADGGFNELAFLEAAGVLFGDVGEEPEVGEVGDFEDGVGGLDDLAEGDFAIEDNAVHGGDDAGGGVDAAGFDELVDGFREHAEEGELIAGGVDFGGGLGEFGFAALDLGGADDAGVEEGAGAFDGALGELALGGGFEEGELGFGEAGGGEGGEELAALHLFAFADVEGGDSAHDGGADAGDAGFIEVDAGGNGEGGADFGDDGGFDCQVLANGVRGGDFQGIGGSFRGGRFGGGGCGALLAAATSEQDGEGDGDEAGAAHEISCSSVRWRGVRQGR
jgi:hypothetical protein